MAGAVLQVAEVDVLGREVAVAFDHDRSLALCEHRPFPRRPECTVRHRFPRLGELAECDLYALHRNLQIGSGVNTRRWTQRPATGIHEPSARVRGSRPHANCASIVRQPLEPSVRPFRRREPRRSPGRDAGGPVRAWDRSRHDHRVLRRRDRRSVRRPARADGAGCPRARERLARASPQHDLPAQPTDRTAWLRWTPGSRRAGWQPARVDRPSRGL